MRDADRVSHLGVRLRPVRLNGWQRLWIVLFVGWTVLVALFSYYSFPARRWALPSQEWINAASDRASASHEELKTFHIEGLVTNIPFPKSLGNDEIVRQLDEEVSRVLDAQRRDWLEVTIGLWLVPFALLYAIGWSIGWIRRGFARAQ